MTVIDDLFEGLEKPQRQALEHIRQTIHRLVPEAQEVMTYGMPGFKYKGKYLISFGAFKDHLSIFPGAKVPEVLKDELGAFKCLKGTIQFTLDNPIPDATLEKIITLCAEDVASRAK